MDIRNFTRRTRGIRKADVFNNDFYEKYHWGKLFLWLFNEYYSLVQIREQIDSAGLIESIISGYKVDENNIIKIERVYGERLTYTDYDETETLIILPQAVLISIQSERIDIFYSPRISGSLKSDLLGLIDPYRLNSIRIRKFHMVQYSRGSFELADFAVTSVSMDLDMNYNDDLIPVDNLIGNSLRNGIRNGLILLHGKQGTGKTSYIRYLIENIDREFIYFPLSMIETINSPEFLPFIARHTGAVLILEDCEAILAPRVIGQLSQVPVANLLNMGDGLLSDALSINLICTFNTSFRKIDEALLRKGRLLARYEFTELEPWKARRLLKSLGKEGTIDKPVCLSEIYNYESVCFQSATHTKIGYI